LAKVIPFGQGHPAMAQKGPPLFSCLSVRAEVGCGLVNTTFIEEILVFVYQ
jgi:hypothetical protein